MSGPSKERRTKVGGQPTASKFEVKSEFMPTPIHKIGREFVKKYYIIMNKSPENLHCFYTNEASFIHDDVDPNERQTIEVEGKMAIREAMVERSTTYQHTHTRVHTVDTMETLQNCLIVQVNGEISYNEQPLRPFSQTVILTPKNPFNYFVQNDIFRFCDFESGDEPSSASSEKPKPMDWGSQCEEYVAPNDDEKSHKTRARSGHRKRGNEVKLDTSDSGLSSDAEKAIMDLQSLNLKSILQEPRTITKETVKNCGLSSTIIEEVTEPEIAAVDNGTSKNHMFRDSCILTIGNVINPNIEFDNPKHEEEDNSTHAESLNAVRSDENSGKMRYKKRKDKRRSKLEMSNEQTEHSQPPDVDAPIERVVVKREFSEDSIDEQSTQIADDTGGAVDDSIEEEPSNEPIEETPKVKLEHKTYADLAKSGADQWVDELPPKRESKQSTDRSRRQSMSRRGSRSEKNTSPINHPEPPFPNRAWPKTDLLQIFVGNIPHTASEEALRRMFSRFGRLTRVRLLTNTRKEWLPRYAFITYENVESVQSCLSKKNTFYWPENAPDAHKLNVNGDPTIDVWEETGHRRSSDIYSRTRDLKKFSRNFVLDTKDDKRTPESDKHTPNSTSKKHSPRT